MTYYDTFTISGDNTIVMTKRVFARTDSGKSWKSKPESVETEKVDNQFYVNFIRSVPFFKGFCGGKCKAYKTYTSAGHIPTRIVTTSPDGTQKEVTDFTIERA